MTVNAHPISAALGLEVTGMTSERLVTRVGADAAQAALDRHGVVVYREVNISDEGLLESSRMLGDSGGSADRRTSLSGDPDHHAGSDENQRATGFLPSGQLPLAHRWRHRRNAAEGDAVDRSGRRSCGRGYRILHTYAAYDALPEEQKAHISGLQVVHTFAHAQSLANPDATEEQRSQWNRVPARTHPLVWTHRDGRKSMLLGATADKVVGWPSDDSRELLDRLLDWSTQPQFTIRHQWRTGDLVMWDNTGMLHRALSFEPTSVRLMHRTTLAGEEPVVAA